MAVRSDSHRRSLDVSMSYGRTSPSKKPLPLEPRASSPLHIEHPSTSVPHENERINDAPGHITSPDPPPSLRRSVQGTPRRPRQHRHDSMSEIERRLDDVEFQVKEKNEEIQRLRQENEELKKVWMDAAANLADTRATISHTLEDGFFISEWKRLQYDIRNWSLIHFERASGGFTKWFRRDWAPSKNLSDLTPYWKTYLRSDTLRPLLAEALVWNLLQKLVFAWPPSQSSHMGNQKPCGAYWAYNDQSSVANINERMKPKVEMIRDFARLGRPDAMFVKEYFAWRVATGAWIQHYYGVLLANREDRNPNIDDLVSKIKNTLSPFTESVGSVEIGQIISRAVHLDSRMWLQKAFFHPSKPKWIHNGQNQRERFHPDTMELYGNAQPDELNPNPEITLIISPSLIKSGNSDGENYDDFDTLVKAQVSCEPLESRQEYWSSPRTHSNQSGFKNSHSSIVPTTVVNSPKTAKISRTNSGAARGQPPPGHFDPRVQSVAPRRHSHDVSRNNGGGRPMIGNHQQ